MRSLVSRSAESARYMASSASRKREIISYLRLPTPANCIGSTSRMQSLNSGISIQPGSDDLQAASLQVMEVKAVKMNHQVWGNRSAKQQGKVRDVPRLKCLRICGPVSFCPKRSTRRSPFQERQTRVGRVVQDFVDRRVFRFDRRFIAALDKKHGEKARIRHPDRHRQLRFRSEGGAAVSGRRS